MSEYRTSYTVTGMTCGHCVASVTEELSELDAVDHVEVTLDTGEVNVRSSAPLREQDVRDAVAEAGYALA